MLLPTQDSGIIPDHNSANCPMRRVTTIAQLDYSRDEHSPSSAVQRDHWRILYNDPSGEPLQDQAQSDDVRVFCILIPYGLCYSSENIILSRIFGRKKLEDVK